MQGITSRADLIYHGGDDGREVPPVPIPNTEVKLSHAESTWASTPGGQVVATFHCPLAQSVEHAAVNRSVDSSSLPGAAMIADEKAAK